MPGRRVALIQRAETYVFPALARRLASSGHDLVLQAPRAGLVEELTALGATVHVADPEVAAAGGDITAAGAKALVDAALARFGRLDAAALTPASLGVGVTRGPFLEADVQHLRDMSGYLETTFHILRAVIPAMRERGGQVLVFTSDAGTRPEPDWTLYGAARAGQTFLARAVALEHARDGICLNVLASKNAVFPGFPGAPSGSSTDDAVTPGPWSAALEAETPLGRLGTMEELAAFAAVLLDGSNRFQTAQRFSYSGGWSEV